MKFLHLADLHFGKSLYGVSMVDNKDQEFWTGQFLEKVEEIEPDAVVIAGDIYDRSAPSGEAVRLFDSMLTSLESMGIPVLMVAGNHDSGQRLSFAGDILAKQNIHIAGVLTEEIYHVDIPEKGGLGTVTFWLMPYLFPAAVAQKLGDDSINDYDTAMRRLLTRQDIDFSQRNVLVAHQNIISGGKEVERGGSESMVGGVGQIDYTAFDGFDYVALGHIHSSYHVGRKEVRYAGSPLCYHFDETRQPQKGPLLVEIGEKGSEVKIETQLITPLHVMREMKGGWEEMKRAAESDSAKNEYLRIVITDQKITPYIAEFLREIYKKRGSVVMELVSDFREYDAVSAHAAEVYGDEKSIEEYFAELYRERKNRAEPDEKEWELFRFAAERARNAGITEKPGDGAESDAEGLLEYVLKQEGEKI